MTVYISIFKYLYFLQMEARILSAYLGRVFIVFVKPSIKGKGKTNFSLLA